MLPLSGRFFVLPIAAVLIITALPRVPTASVEPGAAAETVLKAQPAQRERLQPQNPGTEIRLASVAAADH